MRLSPRTGIWLVGIAAIAGVLLYQAFADAPGTRTQDGQVVTEIISAADGNATVDFDIELQEGGDAAHEAAHIFESIQSQAIESASLDGSTLTLRVRYDSASIEEADIRQMLASKGYIAVSADDAVAAALSADGTGQEIAVTPGERLDPPLMSAKAGLPISIVFAPGEGHLSSVKIVSLGVQQDISQGGILQLPALAPGTYEIVCEEGYADGTLFVR